MYNPSGPSCMRWNVRGFLKINFIGVSSWQRSVSGEHRLCRATLHRHLGGRAHSRLTRDSPEVGIVTKRMPAQIDGLTVRLETNSPTSGFQVVLLDLAGVVGQGSRRVGKDPLS